MALSNSERQARYRKRLKALAERGQLSEPMIEMLTRIRRHLREWKRSAGALECGAIRLLRGNIDASTEHVEMLRRLVEQNELLIAELDPEGLTADDNVELGPIPPETARELWKGRVVTYGLDEAGRAVDVRICEPAYYADLEVSGRSDRFRGEIGDDSWSIVPTSRA